MNMAALLDQANSGDVVAETTLGVCFLEGIGVQVDYYQALRFLSAASEKGAARATLNLARMYAGGLGVSPNPQKAARLYAKAAHRGEFLAQIELGRMYSRKKTARSKALAVKWFSAASRHQDIADCDELREAKAYLADTKKTW